MSIILQNKINNPKPVLNKNNNISAAILKTNLFLVIITCFLIISIIQSIQINKLIALTYAESYEITGLKTQHNITFEKYTVMHKI